MSTQQEWTRESERSALDALRRAGQMSGTRPLVLVYTRQSVSDFDARGIPRGPSLDQQLDSVSRLPDLQGLPTEHYQDADRSGKETSRRPGYRAMLDRIRAAKPGASAPSPSTTKTGCTATTSSSSASWPR
ncbi:MAG: hypothetical protein ACREQM_02390 [Candidatus Dormibacteraceae bacterium]